jgi:hypothetical protein
MSDDDDPRPEDFSTELKPIEAALGALVPASRIDRDRLMYLAGAASVTGAPHAAVRERNPRIGVHRLFWPLAAAAMFLVSLGLGGLLAFREPGDRIVYVDRPPAASERTREPSIAALNKNIEPHFAAGEASTDASYLVLREQVLRLGINALDTMRHETGRADDRDVRNRAMLDQFLGS